MRRPGKFGCGGSSGREFYPQTGLTQVSFPVLSASPRGGRAYLRRPETRMGREPVEPDPASTGGGIGMYTFLRAACAIPFLFVTVAASADDASFAEVVVTADLRDRELRNLPASVMVLDAHTLEVAGVQHFEDVLALVPN